MACTGLEAASPICLVARSIGSLGSSVTNSVFSSVATAFANTADSAINWLWAQMSSSTSISLGGSTFELDLGIVTAIAAVVCVGLFIVQLVTSALRQDGGGVGRALRGLAVATVGCAITLATLELLLTAVDQLCAGVVQLATGGSIATLGAKIIGPALFTGLVAGPGTILILSLVAICAVAIVWFALVVRKMLIIVTAIFAPLAFAGGIADVSRGWVRQWIEAMLALVFSKLILILIFVIGLGVLGGMGSPAHAKGLTSITGDITGLLILLVAGLSPWMALKLVHFTGDHMATMSRSAGHATAGASTVIGAPQKIASTHRSVQSLGGAQRKVGASMSASGVTATNSGGTATQGTAGVGVKEAATSTAGVTTMAAASGAVLATSAASRAKKNPDVEVTGDAKESSAVADSGTNWSLKGAQGRSADHAVTAIPNRPKSGIVDTTSSTPQRTNADSSPSTSFPSSVPPPRFPSARPTEPKESP